MPDTNKESPDQINARVERARDELKDALAQARKAVRGVVTRITGRGTELFNELVRTGESLQQATDPEQRQLLEQIRQGEIESCKLLLNCLQHLGVEPNKDTGAFYGKAMAIESLDERLPFVDKGQQWVIRKLREYMPGCQDPLLRSELQRMLDIHEENSAASHA